MVQGLKTKSLKTTTKARARAQPYSKTRSNKPQKAHAKTQHQRTDKEVTKMINKNIEAMAAAKALQGEGRLTLRDVKAVGKERLRKAQEDATKDSRKARLQRQKDALIKALEEERGGAAAAASDAVVPRS